MKQTTFVLCDNKRQADDVLKVVISSNMGINATLSEICEDGRMWIKIHYETGADLILLGILLGRETDLYQY